MLLTVVSLIVYVAAAFFDGQEEPRFAVFTDKARCEDVVAEARASGAFVTDCTAVTLPAPKVQKSNSRT